MLCSAVGDGCPLLSTDYDSSRQSVQYFIQAGVLFASTTCQSGFTPADLRNPATLIRCSNSLWTSRLPRCTGTTRLIVAFRLPLIWVQKKIIVSYDFVDSESHKVDSNRLRFNVRNEIALTCAKFDADLINTSKVTSRKTKLLA